MNGALLYLALAAALPEAATVAFRPAPAEARVPELFRLPAADFVVTTRPLLKAKGFSVHAVRFPSPLVTPDAENNTVHAEYFLPDRPGKRPAVVVLHILGADFALSRYLAARLAEKGVAALFMKLPYYGERRGAAKDQRFLSANIERSVLAMRQGTCDVRRAATWLASRPEVDASRLGVTGISLGGIVASVAAAVDPALSRGAFLLAGGDLARILWDMPDSAPYRATWIAAGRTFDDLRALTRPLDPLTYADRLAGKRVLMLAGNVDELIPPAAVRALWSAAGRPRLEWFDCGHFSAAGFLLPVIRRTVDFFAEEGAD